MLFAPLLLIIAGLGWIVDGNYLTGTLAILLVLAFQVMYILDCTRRQLDSKPLWILFLVFMFSIAFLVYWLSFYRESAERN